MTGAQMNRSATMPDRQIIFWLGVAVLFISLIALLKGILLPFVLGAAIAYFLDPLADRLEKIVFSRLVATIIIVLFFGAIFVAVLVLLGPLLFDQISGFAAKVPSYVETLRSLVTEYRQKWFGEITPQSYPGLAQAAKDISDQLTNWVAGAITSVLSGGLALVNFISLILITPVVSFYLLKDWDRMIAQIDASLPKEHAPTIRRLAREIDEVISGFVRGQVMVLILLGAFYAIALEYVNLNFGLLIGLGAGLISFIPFAGAMAGFIVAGVVAVVQYWPELVPIATVLGIFIFGQLMEGNVLSPAIVGDRVRLHPVWLIFALFVFGYLFGFVGLLIAVPLAAAMGVIVRFALEMYRESDIYRGDELENGSPGNGPQEGGEVGGQTE